MMDITETQTGTPAPAPERKLKVIHVAGSPVSQYYSMISVRAHRDSTPSLCDCVTKGPAFVFLV